MKRWRIVHDITEGASADPVLSHVFYGETEEQAHRVFAAHMDADAFLRSCVTAERFRDFVCHGTGRLEYLTDAGAWVHVARTAFPRAPRA